MRRLGLIAAMAALLGLAAGAAPGPWDQPAAALAGRIADILGPGQARLTIRNLSSIPDDAVPAILRALEQDLRARGVTVSGADSANAVRVTLSENARNRLWVAEVSEGDDTQVAMVRVAADQAQPPPPAGELLLRSELVTTGQEPVLAALNSANSLVMLEPGAIVIDARAPQGWQEQKRVSLDGQTPIARDPRGILMPSADGAGFEAWLPGAHCTGSVSQADAGLNWSVECSLSDDPWPLASAIMPQSPPQAGSAAMAENAPLALKAFYNAARNYFTGVVSPGVGVDLPAFYSAALIPRAAGNGALLLDGIDGKVELAENGSLGAVAGARDWGSDLAVLRSGCGTGTQILASGSGEAVSDSLRAFELPALEAVPVSPPLAMDGTVTAVWSAPDFKSVYAAVRTPKNQFEVVRVSALCN
ncbi:MAG TPA: hypothetical protein VMD55_09245 [Terracidiphilus sp.]|nr:hypothetical protein [Terracidiphilus sp.]